nr:immunoglobulin heavy chain junction region [Macaca mulatta]
CTRTWGMWGYFDYW